MSTNKEPHQLRSGLLVPGRSYVAAATNSNRISTTKQSFLVKTNELASTANDSNSEFQDLKTRIWRHSRSPGGYLLDVSSLNVPDQVHLGVIGQQYGAKNFYGIKFLGRIQQRYIEIYPRKSISDKLMTEGVQYEKQKIRLLCCKHDLFSVRHQSGQCSTMLILNLCFDSFVTSVKRYIWKSMLSATNLHKLSITEYKVVLEWITINPC
jgi:hypothetical protein